MSDIFDLVLKAPTMMLTGWMSMMNRTMAGMSAFVNPPPGLLPPEPDPSWPACQVVPPVAFPIPNLPVIRTPTTANHPPLPSGQAEPEALFTPTPNPEPDFPIPEPAPKEANKMGETFSDKNVTTVQYQVLFIKRDYEAILRDTRTVVTQHLSADGFVAWRIADFISDMSGHGVHLDQSQARTLGPLEGIKFQPPYDPCNPDWGKGGARLVGMSNDNNQYLRIEYQVLSSISREDANYDEDQTKALQDIARKLPSNCDDHKGKHKDAAVAGYTAS